MEAKIIEYGIWDNFIKYKTEQTKVISKLLFTFSLTNYKNVSSDKTFTFSCNIFIFLSQLQYHEFRKYSSNQILKVYKTPNHSFVNNINMFF